MSGTDAALPVLKLEGDISAASRSAPPDALGPGGFRKRRRAGLLLFLGGARQAVRQGKETRDPEPHEDAKALGMFTVLAPLGIPAEQRGGDRKKTGHQREG